jgi:hypothetical protein
MDMKYVPHFSVQRVFQTVFSPINTDQVIHRKAGKSSCKVVDKHVRCKCKLKLFIGFC